MPNWPNYDDVTTQLYVGCFVVVVNVGKIVVVVLESLSQGKPKFGPMITIMTKMTQWINQNKMAFVWISSKSILRNHLISAITLSTNKSKIK